MPQIEIGARVRRIDDYRVSARSVDGGQQPVPQRDPLTDRLLGIHVTQDHAPQRRIRDDTNVFRGAVS